MQIETTVQPKTLLDYSFTLEGAVGLPFTLDPTIGDSIDFGDTNITIQLAPRPHISDPTKFTSRQEVTIKTAKVLAFVRTEVLVYPQTDEQKEAWKKLTSSKHRV